VWFGSHRREWIVSVHISIYLAHKLQFLSLFLHLVFFNEPQQKQRETAGTRSASCLSLILGVFIKRVVTGTRKFDHITPVLHQLHWLPVHQRITFKLAVIIFKCLCGLAPSYLADVCIPVSSVVGRWQLLSANSATLVVPRSRTTIGRRDVAMSGPATWNSLTVELQTSSLSSQTFAKTLKNNSAASISEKSAVCAPSFDGIWGNWDGSINKKV